ncbi:MAG: tRNA lysidine(34) synthetase TilS [Cycloclasticus sp.]
MKQLVDIVEQQLASIPNVTQVVIAYSGGVDSHVLLHACSRLKKTLPNFTFSAMYIDHGLHEDSAKWRDHCESACLSLAVDFMSQKVNAEDANGDGPEQAARLARYDALKRVVTAGTVLLTAQHQDDQAETLMLQLLRGAGVDGLASMPTCTDFGLGYIARPLLNVSKAEIKHYAKEEGLEWIEDSSNLDTSLNRNFLRQQVIPLIQQRWPAFSKTTSRSAAHCAEASSILFNLASLDMGSQSVDVLDMRDIIDLDAARQRLLIRHWLSCNKIRMPSEKILTQIQRYITLDSSASALIEWPVVQVRLFDAKLFFTRVKPEGLQYDSLNWSDDKVEISRSLGTLSRNLVMGQGIDQYKWAASKVTVVGRSGGESIKLLGRDGRKKLKKLFHEAKIFPWVRNVVPLVYLDGKLAAIANLWVDEAFLASENDMGYDIVWEHLELKIK